MTRMTQDQYQTLYRQSLKDPKGFWAEQSKALEWIAPFQSVYSGSLAEGDGEWFVGGKLNVSVNCLDRHLPHHADKIAIIWEGDQPTHIRTLSYRELFEAVCRCANLLKSRGLKKGDRVCLYMPSIPEAAIAMLACARIGAVHSVVFGGFSAESLQNRIVDADCQCVITTNSGMRGGNSLPFKDNVDAALVHCPKVHTVIVVEHGAPAKNWVENRDVHYQKAIATLPITCEPEAMDSEAPLFILYTSGSTGKPKGVVHTTAGYLLYASFTHKTIFDLKDDDIYWCTADVGWITGHSYVVYGPLANATTTLMYESIPTYPSAARYWEMIDRHKVSIFYTAPTAVRALMQKGDEPLKTSTRQSLRLLGSVGEPINPEAWQWYFHQVGQSRCPIMDTWWQTETGGIMIAPFTDAPQKPSSAMHPFFGIEPAILDATGKEIDGVAEGMLVIKSPWPGMMRTIYGNHSRFMEGYFKLYGGYYFTGDGAKRDKDGHYWITGRIDDVLNVAGHRLSTAEIESALVLHDAVAEAAVVGAPHAIKGEGICAYVILMADHQASEQLKKELIALVRKQIGPIATLDQLIFTTALPKTRSGKIMRRILRKIAHGEFSGLGDTSTLANPECVEALVALAKAS